MMDVPRYTSRLFWSAEDEAFVAICPELGGISALGETRENAVAELSIAISLTVETYLEEGWDLPAPLSAPAYSGQFRVRLPKSLHAWLAEKAAAEDVSLNTLVIHLLSRARGGLLLPADAAEEFSYSPPGPATEQVADRTGSDE
jgi:predicted RNase H-like HicB family nuclease